MNTKLLAQLARESYTHCTYQDKDMDAQALVVRLEECTVVAPRGTTSFKDAITDSRFFPTRCDWTGYWYHRGFYKYAHALIDNIFPDIGDGGNVIFTGHSLGGAAATIMAVHYHHIYGVKPRALVTFGEPEPGFAGLGEAVRKLPGYRFASSGDPVEWMIPSIPFILPYQHGREVYTLPDIPGLDHPIDSYYQTVPEIKV